MARPWRDFNEECKDETPPNVFAPFGNSAIISYHSVGLEYIRAIGYILQ